MPDRWSRLAPLTGVAFAVLLFVAFAAGGGSPGVHDGGQKVISYYQAHHANAMATDFIAVVGVVFLLCFAASLRVYLRRTGQSSGPAALGFAGAIVLAVGGASFSALDWSLADARSTLDPSSAQALSVLANDFFWPFAVGTSVFLIGNGLGIVRSTALPRWLGWVAFVLGVIAVTPAAFFVFLALMAWSLIVSILMFMRWDRPAAGAPDAVSRA